jgi:NitT/TauT family transport system ATP-binding protein
LKAVAGEITVLLGGSGCGKTTILNLIAGLLTPSAGIIELETNLSLAKVERVGFVFQTPTLIPWLSVRDNALFATLISGTPSERIHAEADRLLDEFGIASVKNAFPRTLSGGMQQRVALIRAVLSEAPVLLLDEPFSNSDLVMRRILHEELRKGVRGRNLIALLVTHDVADAALLGDNIYVLTPRPASVAFSIRNPMSKHDREFLDKDARRQLADLEHLISQKLLATTNGG